MEGNILAVFKSCHLMLTFIGMELIDTFWDCAGRPRGYRDSINQPLGSSGRGAEIRARSARQLRNLMRVMPP